MRRDPASLAVCFGRLCFQIGCILFIGRKAGDFAAQKTASIR
ncbi:hypothetical protein [Yoonia sp. R78084]